MSCLDCRYIGGKDGCARRCHKLPPGLVGTKAEKWVRHPGRYHCDEHPCPDFEARKV